MRQIGLTDTRSNGRMRLFAATVVALVSLAAFTGCGTIPDATVPYNLTKSAVSFKITRTVACDANNHTIVSTAVVPSVVHSAGIAASAVQLKQLKGTFSDSDVKFELYDDGRLKGVNASSTGQGDTILKTVTTLAGTIASFALDGGTPPTFPEECKFIRAEGGGKPLALTYEGPVKTSVTDNQPIPPDLGSQVYANKLAAAIGDICAVVEGVTKPVIPLQYEPNGNDILLWAQQPGQVTILVSRPVTGGLCAPTGPFWHGQVAVAQLGTVYPIPMPSPKLFGKESFSVAFSDSGALTSVQFTSTNGSAQALGSLNTLITSAQGESVAAKAAELKAQADLIAQQQRLTACLSDPKNCK